MLPTNILYRTFFIRAGQYGTAFTLDIDGQEFLITAAHLLDEVNGSKEIKVLADSNFKRPSGPRLPTTFVRVSGLMLRPSLGAKWLAWVIWAASRLRRRAFGRCRATQPASRAARRAPTPAFAAA